MLFGCRLAAVVFVPIWLVEAIVLLALLSAVAKGPSTRPADLPEDEDWEDEDPLRARQLGLANYALFVLAQVLPVTLMRAPPSTSP